MAKQKKVTVLKEAKFVNQANLVRRLRKNNGYTQRFLADKTKLNVQYISNIERGKCGMSANVARNLIKLGLTKEEIVTAYKKDVGMIFESAIKS